MSDDDFMMDAEDYGFEYESEEEDEPDVNLENKYYNAKALKEDDPRSAIDAFRDVVSMETEKGEWGFRALKQLVKLQFKLGKLDAALESYRALLTYIKSAVTRNYSEKSINNLLDHVSSAQRTDFMEEFYATTLAALDDAKNDRLSFKTNLKLAKLWLDRGEFGRLGRILRQLHAACTTEEGDDDAKKGTQLLEVYALEIQMHTATKNTKKLKELYQRSLRVKSAIPHPRIMGVIRECGGKMHISEGQWQPACQDFFAAFKNYDESGSPRRIQCLKYLVLAHMLDKSEVDPFTAPETKPYRNDPEIRVMTSLISAFQRSEINEFERILRDNERTIMDDAFIRDHVETLLRNVRTQVLLKLIRPYTRLNLHFIARELNLQLHEVESLLVALILDGEIRGRIDQVNGRLELDPPTAARSTHEAVGLWIEQAELAAQALTSRLA